MISLTPFSLCCCLLLCLPLLFFSTTTISTTTNTNTKKTPFKHLLLNTKTTSIPPPKPPLLFSDTGIFRLASRVNKDPLPKTSKKVAFMFLTTSPLPFAPLWQTFFAPKNQTQNFKNLYNIYIHADPSYRYDPPFSGIFTNRTIPSKPTQRSHPSLISAARRLLAHALLHDPSNAMFALISPACIPLRSFPFVYRTLTTHSTKTFIEILSGEPNIEARYAARGEGVMLPEVRFEDFRVGSQFFVLTRRHASLVVRDKRLWRKFKLPCLTYDTCYPEEHYFPTLLNMKDPDSCVHATLTHVDWTGSVDGHPRMYGGSEVGPELIWKLRRDALRYGDGRPNCTQEYKFLFARKFSPESIEPLMDMAEDVIFRD